MELSTLNDVANAMVADGKGILAADESTGTIGKRFDQIDLENTVENRNAYRDLLFNANEIENYISGVIMYDETFRQSSLDGNILYPQHLSDIGIG